MDHHNLWDGVDAYALNARKEMEAHMKAMAETGSVSCPKCNWVYMSAPDRTLHKCGYHVEYRVRDSAEFKQLQQKVKDAIGMAKANDRQEGGDHYKTKAIQPWDYAIANDLSFMQGSIIKYVTRYKDKNGLADLRKAMHFLEKLIETEQAKIIGNG